MGGVVLQVLAKISPPATNAYHDALAVLAHAADKELDGRLTRRPREVVHLDVLLGALRARPRVLSVSGGQGEAGR